MATLMLVSNPTKKGKRKMAKPRRTAAQRAATKKMIAANRARSSTPAKPRRRRARAASATAAVKRTYRRAASATRRAVRRTRRSQSILGRQGFGIVNLLKQSGMGAVGALAIDLVYAKLPIPDTMKAGNMAPITKAAVTIGLGMLAGKVLSKPMAHGAVVGALTVQLHEVLKNFSAGMGLSGYTDINGISYYSPAEIADSGVGMYLSDASGVGEYVSGVEQYEQVY